MEIELAMERMELGEVKVLCGGMALRRSGTENARPCLTRFLGIGVEVCTENVGIGWSSRGRSLPEKGIHKSVKR